MSRIRILDESVSNIIAAGEVVENPASMIKELIENSLDAGAGSIRVEVKNNGRDVRLVDTGMGMGKEDLFLCVERHATSKIKDKGDIFNLTSYGFRGEALASIGSISKMIISSKTNDSKTGHKINLNAGKVTKYEEISRAVGTEIVIKDLFFNTPARLKFLRKKSTEYARIREIVLKEALYNTEVSFSLLLDGREVVKTSGRGIENTILELFGRNTLKNSTKFSLGYWGNMNLLKSNKDSIYTYVNGRYVKSKTIEKAVLDAYYTKLTRGRYPFAIIFFDISPDLVDINVHPSKKIIKFVDEDGVYREILDCLTDAIYRDDRKNSISLKIEEDGDENQSPIQNNLLDFEELENLITPRVNKVIKTEQPALIKEEKLKNKVSERIAKAYRYSQEYEATLPSVPPLEIKEDEIPPEKGKESVEIEKILVAEKQNDEDHENPEEVNEIKNDYRVLAQLHNMYILVETEEELEIYDQHIVHERILYEKLKDKHYNKKISVQNLLVPIKLELNGYETEIVRGNLELFSEFGFEVEEFCDNEILIRGVPIFNFRVGVEDTFRYLLENLGGGDPREKVIISMSCRNAIKAGEKLTLEEMETLISDLHKVGKYTCPHGRPIILKMTFDEMNKKFNRK
ncbi:MULTISPECIES: DNA mismatch repair endonuclease MutL [Psychrilyobacter]|uniref:DNA mismatch repair protein MutL n=1 Tax=Psychrilyobacter piezotolerans TaxID=2293438 RepID=A0ABX9KGS5_9FUSO|nr:MULTISPECIES: DNA mismatch repair endonuclease MutL [Psychrilyobacter]MCS5420732.1 DNA mismatch repair endonuclease MutL [Psychrilyobacter sp. S5]NDI77992.1 DNA mismatch repair endonuclease MutL [Psychrilyobacter piezotolerans]RDE61935.1 DNA mismatch repair endonuclease MutL [Psychrilyobacter sp. S5]REI41161.1 DNA mismatch repair endonuclease MutL [Psychrilyobacter piezotolerans]